MQLVEVKSELFAHCLPRVLFSTRGALPTGTAASARTAGDLEFCGWTSKGHILRDWVKTELESSVYSNILNVAVRANRQGFPRRKAQNIVTNEEDGLLPQAKT